MLRVKRTALCYSRDTMNAPFVWVALNCGHMAIFRRECIPAVFFGLPLRCAECIEKRDV